MNLKIFVKNHYVILVALAIFITIVLTRYEFYKAIVLLLEFIVILEVVKMVADFIEKRKLRLRFVIDVFIIFLIREVIILATKPVKDEEGILFLLFVIFIFFIFRILALVYSPTMITKKRFKQPSNTM